MKTVLTIIAIAFMFSGQAIAGDGLEGIAASSFTKEQIEELLVKAGSATTFTTCYQVFAPKDDITVHELALCLSVLLDRQSVDLLPKKAARHFREVCQ